jgi:uncharacterized protein (DUF1330 family)
MPVYMLAEVKVTEESWIPEYAARVHEIVGRHGGKYLARSGNIATIEGEPLDATIVVIVEFPTREAAEAFAKDPEYAPFAESRKRGSVSRLYLIDDTDLAGTIPYLRKAQ